MKKRIILLLSLLVLLPGCAKQLKTVDGEIVKNEETGQVLIQNILCSPDNPKTLQKYRDHREEQTKILNKKLEEHEITKKKYNKELKKLVDVDKLDKCSDFKVTTGKYESIWTSIFVKPLAWILINIGKLLNSYGFAIIAVTLLLRLLMYPVTRKTAMQSENIKKAQPEIDKLEKKYRNKTDQESLMKKNQETLLIYKKYDINPISGCVFAFLQIPLFFAFYESLSRTPAIFEGTFLKIFDLGTSPSSALFKGEWWYLILVALVIGTTYYSFKLNRSTATSSDQEKQMRMMTNIMVIMICIATFTMSTAIALYWIFNSAFTILQNLLVKRRSSDVK